MFLTVMAFLFYFVCYTIIIFSNTALVGVSMKLLQGDKATMGDGIAIAMGRLGQILGFALISATIGTLAQETAYLRSKLSAYHRTNLPTPVL